MNMKFIIKSTRQLFRLRRGNKYKNPMKMNHIKASLLALAAAGLFAPQMFGAVVTYDFEGLTAGALAVNGTVGGVGNQDRWYTYASQPSTVVATGTGIDTTKVATNVTFSTSSYGIRNFGATPFYSGTETSAEFHVDFRLGAGSTAGYFSLLGNGNATYAFGGSQTTAIGVRMTIATATNGTSVDFGLAYGGTAGSTATQNVTFASMGGASIGDWIQLKMVMDFTANTNDGAGTLWYKDLTLGQTSFTQLTTIGTRNLGLTTETAGFRAANWNQVFMRVGTGAGGAFPAVDNIAMVPEPATWALLAFSLTSVMVLRRRRNS